MKRRKGWLWALGAAIAFAISTVMMLTSPVYDDMVRWWQPASLAVILAVLAFWLRSSARKAETEEAARKLEAQQAEKKKREELEATVRAFRERYPQFRFAVAGVTFKNDDKTDRQQILREIVLNEQGSCDVWFEEDDEEDSGIRVLTDCGCVGYIRRSDKKDVRRFLSNTVTSSTLEAELFETDEGDKLYRADVVFVLDRESPLQKWYFDELSEQ